MEHLRSIDIGIFQCKLEKLTIKEEAVGRIDKRAASGIIEGFRSGKIGWSRL